MRQFSIEFLWSRDRQRRFELRTVKGERVVATNVVGEKFEAYRPLVDAEARPMLLAFAKIKDETAALGFVNMFGALTHDGNSRRGQPVREILGQAKEIRDYLSLITDADSGELEGRLEDEPSFGTLGIRLTPAIDPTEPPRMVLTPGDLSGALFFLLADRLANGTVFRRCPRCGDIFDVGEGTGRTLKTRFCEEDHRKQFNSLKRSKGK